MARAPSKKALVKAFASDDDEPVVKAKKATRVVAVEDDDEPTPERRVSKGARDVVNDEKVWIILEDNPNIPPTGQYIAINGRNWHLKSGVAVAVPRPLLNVLDDAIESVPIKDADGDRIIGYRDKLRFPYRLVKEPRQAA